MPESITDKLEVKNLYLQNLGVADRQTITTTDLISEGPIHGLVDGQASIFLNDDRAVPLSQATTFHSTTKATVSLTNNSTTATIVDGGATPILEAENGDKYLIVRKGYGSVYVTASGGSAEPTNGNISCTLTTDGNSSFFTDSMISSPADYDTFVPARLIALTDAHGETNEGHGEGYITKRSSVSVCTFIPGAFAPAGLWIPEGDYYLEVDRIVKIASISGATLTLSSAWTGVTGSFKYDASGAIISNSDEVRQTEIANYEGITTQFRIGSHSQVPFRGQNELGSTSISNTPSAGGVLEQTQGYGSGSQAPKVLIASSTSGFNLTASQIQEVDEARFTIAYAGGFYAVSGLGNDKNTYAQYQFKIAIKKPGESDFEAYTFLENPKTHSGGAFKNSVTWVYKIDLDEYRPFIDFKVEVRRITNHTGPGYKKLVNGVAETFHDWQNVTQSALTNTTCVIKDRLTHPYSAMAKVSFSTSQFTSMPTRSYHARGLKVQVPSNYVTREENGGISSYTRNISSGAITNTYQDWDGSFRRFPVYTNNPAWVFYDILTNDRYGLGEFLASQDIDKYMLYRIARYCDELVPDGKGGEEPRFTANLYLTKRADAYKVIKDIATIFRGMVYYFDGQVSPIIDAPSGPVYTFTKANVLGGQFSYEGTGSKTRINQVIVTWTNPEASYKAEPLIVEDRKNIADTGQIISQSAVAMGAITEGQALRYGRWKLWTAANQKEIVSFSTSLNGSFLVPGDVINIQDSDRYSRRYGGRISNSGTARSTTSIPLDNSVSLISGSTYTLSVLFEEPGAFATSDVTINGIAYKKGDLVTQAFIDGDGDGGSSGNGTYTLQNIDSEVKAQNAKASATGTDALLLSWSDTHRAETKPVTQSLVGTNTSTITVTQAFSAVPAAETIWVLTETSGDDATVEGSAKQYKILSLTENSKNEYSIAAVEHYDEKFSAIEEDFTTFVADTVYPAVRTTDVVPPVIDIHATNKPKKHGGVSEGEVTIKWTPPRNIGSIDGVYEHLIGYEIVHSFETIPSPIKITDPNQTSLFLNSIEDGKYKVSIRVINILNNVSAPTIALVSVSSRFKEPIPRLANGVPFCGTTSTGFSLSGNTFQFKKYDYTFKPPSDNAKSVTNTVTAVSAWQQDCSNLPNITWSESDRNIEGEFIVEHAYILFDSSDTTDRLKLLKYHKPTTIGTSFWYDAGTGNTTNKFGSALSGTFTKAAGSSKVTGSSTAFTTQIEEGDVLKLGSEEIGVAAVESDTILYLERASETAHSGVSGNIQNIRIDFINDVIIARVYKTSSGLVLAETYSKIDAVLKSVTDIANPVTASEMNVSDLGDIATDMTGVTLTNPTITGGNISGFAPLASPAFTGTPTAPTASDGTNTTQLATTQFVSTAVSNLVDSAPSDLNTLNELAAALADDDAFSTTVNTALGNRLRVDTASQGLSSTQKTNGLTNLGIQNINNTSDANKPVSTAQQTALNLKANLASPTFTGTVAGISKSMVGLGNVANESKATMFSSAALTGTPTAPTAGSGTNTTQIATTAFVQAAASSAAGGASGTTYTVSIPSSTTKLRLSGSDSTTDDIEFVGSGATTVTRTNDGKFTISSTDTNTNTNTQNQYAISCVDGDNSDEEKIRLSGSGHNGNTTDDVVLEAGTGLTIARSGDKITFTNSNPTDSGGTVTSVGISHGGNAFNTGSAVTTSGTLAITMAGSSSQYVNGAGNLVTFPNIPSAANNGTITINQEGVQKGQFTVDQSGNTIINLTDNNTDTNTNQLTVFQVENSSSVDQFSVGHGDGLEFVGSGATSVSFDSSNKRVTISSTDTNTQRAIHDTPVDGATTTSISSNWAFDNVKTSVPAGALFTDTNTVYTHPNHSGDVTSSGDGATTIANNAVTFAKMQDIATDTFMGRTASGTGDAKALSVSEARTMLNVENGATADQTASEILTLLKTVDTNTSGLNAATLDGQEGTYYLDYDNFSNTPTISTPAITSNGSVPSLASGITATEVRGLINAGTSSLAVGTSASDAAAGDSLSVTNLNAIYASFGTMAAEVANIGTLKTDFLDADKVITRDIRVGPTTLVNSGSLVSGRTYTITDSGTGTNTGRFPGATSNDVGVVFTATGTGNGTGGGVARDHSTVALIGGTNASPTLTGQGAHLNSAGDFFVGVHDGARIFFDQSAGTMTVRGTLNASDINTGTLNASNITVTNLSASSITTGALNASLMTTGTLNASNITVTNLDANSINDISLTATSTGSFVVGSSITPGTMSVLIGASAGGQGSGSTATGWFALNHSTGINNTGFGNRAGVSVSSGTYNTFVGAYAGYEGTSGAQRKTGNYNVGIGGSGHTAGVLRDLTSGNNNIAIGNGAGQTISTGSSNICLLSNGGTTGIDNVFIGVGSGDNMTVGSKNVIIGAFNGNENSLDIRTSSNNIVLSDGDSNIRLYVNSSGNTGIGTITQGAKLSVEGPASLVNLGGGSTGSAALYVNAVSGHIGELLQIIDKNNNNRMEISNSTGQVNFTGKVITSNSSGFSGPKFDTTDGTRFLQLSVSSGYNTINSMGSSSGSAKELRFTQGLSGTQLTIRYNEIEFSDRIIISNTGVGDVATTPNIFSTGTISDSTSYNYHMRFTDADGTYRGQITNNKYGTQYTSSSDYRLKTDIQDMSSATTRLLALQPRNFKWTAGDVRADGFIAHEVAEVVPEAVVGEKDGADMQSIDQSKLVPLLVKTIQELEARITALENP